MALLNDIATSFVLGVLTPLTAVCVLPLYPGFLSYLANQITNKDDKTQILKLGLLVSLGVISFMLILGLLFTTLFQKSLTNIIQIISPIAFFILVIISILLIFNVDFSRFTPHINTKKSQNPKINALLYGFFFGGIIMPCNPGFIAAFFTRALLFESPISSLLSFLTFGIGIALPLLILSILSIGASRQIISKFIEYKKQINLIAGLIMLVISIYYLFFVFRIQELIF